MWFAEYILYKLFHILCDMMVASIFLVAVFGKILIAVTLLVVLNVVCVDMRLKKQEVHMRGIFQLLFFFERIMTDF